MASWFCEKLQWFCNGGGGHMASYPPPSAPEIDGAILPYAIAIVVGVSLILWDKHHERS